MKIIENETPKLNRPKFVCDKPLCNHLNTDPLLKYMNKRFACASIGRPHSGKTSHIVSLLTTDKKFKKVFHKIYVFMPETSRQSIKNNPFDELPEDQLFNGITFEDLQTLYKNLQENKENKKLSLVIFDDVQSYMRDPEIETAILHIMANARHLRCSMFFAIQSYNKLSPNIRKILTDYFIFDVAKDDLEKIHQEILTINKKEFEQLTQAFYKTRKEQPHSFLYYNVENQKYFINWNEIILE